MDSDLTLDFIIIIVLIIANGLFSMTELAIVNAKKRKLEELAEAGNERAKKAFELSENPNAEGCCHPGIKEAWLQDNKTAQDASVSYSGK